MCFGGIAFDHVVTVSTHDEVLGSVTSDDAAALRPWKDFVYVDCPYSAIFVPLCFAYAMFVEESGDEGASLDVDPGRLR